MRASSPLLNASSQALRTRPAGVSGIASGASANAEIDTTKTSPARMRRQVRIIGMDTTPAWVAVTLADALAMPKVACRMPACEDLGCFTFPQPARLPRTSTVIPDCWNCARRLRLHLARISASEPQGRVAARTTRPCAFRLVHRCRRCERLDPQRLVDLARRKGLVAFDDQGDVADIGNILRRIAVDQDQICTLALHDDTAIVEHACVLG